MGGNDISNVAPASGFSGFRERRIGSTAISLSKGIRAECYYGGNVAHSTAVANFTTRNEAVFTNLASALVVVKLNRDDPQFSDIPNLAFFIEGRKVKSIARSGTDYSLSAERTYSTNPALCLLDYLLDDTCGKALNLSQIDLKSFDDARQVCAKIVQLNAAVAGKIWQPTNKARSITTRNIPLYECNIVIDVEKPVRENVEAILSTMGDARLIWSGGKYRLSLQYPGASL